MVIQRGIHGIVDFEVHANDYIFRLPSIGGTSVSDFLEDFETLAGTLTFRLNLETCPKCGKDLVESKTAYACYDCAWILYKETLEKLQQRWATPKEV